VGRLKPERHPDLISEASLTRQSRGARARYPPPTVTLDYGSRLRLVAGQPDPADAAHFTIPYQLDGKDGVIDGWLRDEGVVLRPRAGKAAVENGEPAWDLAAPGAPATGPTTRPSTRPG
jgi:hypothetical protein